MSFIKDIDGKSPLIQGMGKPVLCKGHCCLDGSTVTEATDELGDGGGEEHHPDIILTVWAFCWGGGSRKGVKDSGYLSARSLAYNDRRLDWLWALHRWA